MAWHWKPAIRHVCVRRLGKDVPRTVGMMISELDNEIMNNEVVFFFFFLFCRLFLDSGRLHKNDTCCLLLFIYFFWCSGAITIRFEPPRRRPLGEKWMRDKWTPKDVCGEGHEGDTSVSCARPVLSCSHYFLACKQTLFYFSFRSFQKHRQARERSERGARERKINNIFFIFVYFLLPPPPPPCAGGQ